MSVLPWSLLAPTQPEIGQLQGALAQLLCKEALLHHLWCLGLCWPLLLSVKTRIWDFHWGMPHTRASLHLHLQNLDFVAGSSAAQEACHHFPRHASMMPSSCSLSGSWNSRITSCTTWRVQVWFSIKIWLSSSGQLSWRSRSRKRGMPIFCAKRCFKAFTEPSAKSTSSKTAIDTPVTAESTSSMGQLLKKAPKVRDKSEYHI